MASRVGIQSASDRLLMDARWNGRSKSVPSSKRLGGRHAMKHELAADYPSANPSNLRILFPFTCQFCLAAPDSSFRLDLQAISSRASLATHVQGIPCVCYSWIQQQISACSPTAAFGIRKYGPSD